MNKDKKRIYVGYSDTISADDILYWDEDIIPRMLRDNYGLTKDKHASSEATFKVVVERLRIIKPRKRR